MFVPTWEKSRWGVVLTNVTRVSARLCQHIQESSPTAETEGKPGMLDYSFLSEKAAQGLEFSVCMGSSIYTQY